MRSWKFWESPTTSSPTRTKARNRVAHVSERELLEWADNAMASLWKSIESYGKDHDALHLEAAEEGADTLLGVIDALADRAHERDLA